MRPSALEAESVFYTPPTNPLTTITEAAAQSTAAAYVKTKIDARFEVISGAHYFDKVLGRTIWRFYVRGQHTPVGLVKVDAATGNVLSLTSDEVRSLREKDLIAAARKRNELPVDEKGIVFAEYARRSASRYLGDNLSIYFGAADPLFIPGEPPYWQLTIEFKMYSKGPFTLGIIDVDAKTGDVLPLTQQQLEQIEERTCAIIRHQTSQTTGS
jgi:hypothetical protein